jgi:hypothetical protein
MRCLANQHEVKVSVLSRTWNVGLRSFEEIPKAEGSAGIEEALGAARFKNVGRLFSGPENILDLALAILKPT